ncbi:zinc ribbon domain-containing protein [Castellaniella sp. GW247-6E4]|uniref:FmdB family zinc ribbon protein n=1 Tax=Castellaniella sp. GW247-6E4 TaxID=3140380 RepID=UPI0033145BC2
MPIYAYRCSACGHEQDVLRKISDPLLRTCPECGRDTYEKQVTAAGFRLKGTGWYETDFRGGSKPGAAGAEPKSSGGEAPAPAAPATSPSSPG